MAAKSIELTVRTEKHLQMLLRPQVGPVYCSTDEVTVDEWALQEQWSMVLEQW